MDDLLRVQRVQTDEQRVGELAHHLDGEAAELVLADELEEVDVEQLEGDEHLLTEQEVVVHVDHVELVPVVDAAQVLQDLDLLLRLPVEAPFVAHHLQGHVSPVLVVVGLVHHPEAPLPDQLQHLVPVGHVVVRGRRKVLHCPCRRPLALVRAVIRHLASLLLLAWLLRGHCLARVPVGRGRVLSRSAARCGR